MIISLGPQELLRAIERGHALHKSLFDDAGPNDVVGHFTAAAALLIVMTDNLKRSYPGQHMEICDAVMEWLHHHYIGVDPDRGTGPGWTARAEEKPGACALCSDPASPDGAFCAKHTPVGYD